MAARCSAVAWFSFDRMNVLPALTMGTTLPHSFPMASASFSLWLDSAVWSPSGVEVAPASDDPRRVKEFPAQQQ